MLRLHDFTPPLYTNNAVRYSGKAPNESAVLSYTEILPGHLQFRRWYNPWNIPHLGEISLVFNCCCAEGRGEHCRALDQANIHGPRQRIG